MRLLAYGGISYVERRRIGAWPDVPEGALGDPSSLPVDVLAFGVGLLEHKQPFLIIRQRQNIQNRGGYAYTLLLDPGREVWEREDFNWNAARLILSLLAHGQFGARLLTKPEEITEQELEEIFRDLRPAPSAQACPHEPARLRALWTGSVLSPSPLVAAPSDAGFDSRPTLACVADALDELPAPFRCGWGWLVGGSEENGRAFGTRLTLDDGATPDTPKVVNYIMRGEEALSAWLGIKHSDGAPEQFRRGIAQKSRTPIWEWKQFYNEPAADYLARLPKVVGVLTGDDVDTLLGKIDEMARRKELSEEDQLILTQHHSRAVRGRATPGQTAGLLRDFFEYGNELQPEVVRRLHRATVISDLTRRCAENKNLTPSPAMCGLPLRRNIRYEIWRLLLTEVYVAGEVPARLREAVKDQLPAPTAENGDVAPSDTSVATARRPSKVLRLRIARLAHEAIRQTATRGESLLAWREACDDELLAPWVAEPLLAEAERRMQAREGNSWPLDYIAFGDDPGGRRLGEAGFDRADANVVAEAALATAQGSGPLAEQSKGWLTCLADSPLREAIALDTKSRVARSVADGRAHFQHLWQLYHGQTADALTPGSVGEDERVRLRRELHELVAPAGVGGVRAMNRTTPNLRGLVELLGSIPDEDLQELSALKPELTSWEAARGWLDGWLDLNREEVYRSELARFAMRSNSLLPAGFPLERLDDELLRQVFSHLLSEEDDDESCCRRLAVIFGRETGDTRLDDALAVALAESERDSRRAEIFVRRFATRRRTTDLVFRHLDSDMRNLWVSLIAARDEKRFLEEAHGLYEDAVEKCDRKGIKPEGYARAVFAFMCTPAGQKTKSQVAAWYHTFIDADLIDLNLSDLLNEETAPAKERRPGRLERWFGIGRKEKESAVEEGTSDVEKTADDETPQAATSSGDAATAAAGQTAAASPPEAGRRIGHLFRPKTGKTENKDDPQ